jgi:hypothetical protein
MLIYWVEAYILQQNAEALVFASKENGLEVNAENNKCTIMSQDEHADKNTTQR